MDLIKVKTPKGQELEFKAEPNFLETRKINSEMAEVIGGYDKLAKLDQILSEKYEDSISFNIKKYGEAAYKEKANRLRELDAADTESEEVMSLRKDLYDNKYYNAYLNMVTEKALIHSYAWMNVLCVKKPADFEFYEQDELTLQLVWGEVHQQRKFFRRQSKEG